MTDLVSIVVNICSCGNLFISDHMGRAVQHFVLASVRRLDPTLSSIMHDGPDLKPYTVSDIYRDNTALPLRGHIPKGQRAWIRLTALRSDIATVFIEFTANHSSVITINRTEWEVESVIFENHLHVWAGNIDYEVLLRQSMSQVAAKRMSITFAAPTSFHSRGIACPIPLPSLVFGSLLAKWRAFSTVQLTQLSPQEIGQHVAINKYKIETCAIKFKNDIKVGFIGNVVYQILVNNSLAQKRKMSHAEKQTERELISTLITLIHFGFYAGVGITVTAGMGMIKITN